MTVVMSFPLGDVIQNRNATGRITKWALELMGQGISYAPQTATKSQVLADFAAEWTEVQMPPTVVDQEYWTMYFEGVSHFFSLYHQGDTDHLHGGRNVEQKWFPVEGD